MITLNPTAPSIPTPVSHRDRTALPEVGSDIDQRRVDLAIAGVTPHESSARAEADTADDGVSIDDHPAAADRSP